MMGQNESTRGGGIGRNIVSVSVEKQDILSDLNVRPSVSPSIHLAKTHPEALPVQNLLPYSVYTFCLFLHPSICSKLNLKHHSCEIFWPTWPRPLILMSVSPSSHQKPNLKHHLYQVCWPTPLKSCFELSINLPVSSYICPKPNLKHDFPRILGLPWPRHRAPIDRSVGLLSIHPSKNTTSHHLSRLFYPTWPTPL